MHKYHEKLKEAAKEHLKHEMVAYERLGDENLEKMSTERLADLIEIYKMAVSKYHHTAPEFKHDVEYIADALGEWQHETEVFEENKDHKHMSEAHEALDKLDTYVASALAKVIKKMHMLEDRKGLEKITGLAKTIYKMA